MIARTILLAGGGTGGHVFPMIAVAEALKSVAPDWRVVFVGTERGMERDVVPRQGYTLELVRILPIRGAGLGGAVRGVVRAGLSLPEAVQLVKRHRPGAVFSIGGYAAGPVSLAARMLRIPVALMEPNSVMGLANRLTAPLVQRAYLAFDDPERHFKPSAVLKSGVPLRTGFLPQPFRRDSAELKVLVLGGSQGAQSLNETLPEALAKTHASVQITHQCGAGRVEAVQKKYAALGAAERVRVVGFIEDMPQALAAAHLVIGRSGASAVSEICAVGRPSLLIPYPFAAGDHQLKNAEAMERAGAALCLPSSVATADRLAAALEALVAQPETLERMAERARERGRPDAALVIARDLLQLAGEAA
jgi:UDP-N-acetylglucosamine--N-acetylmuramyl-(pentapeptide) pyrophosphoryl-undecaprenol N-acetylglucosamine transferase